MTNPGSSWMILLCLNKNGKHRPRALSIVWYRILIFLNFSKMPAVLMKDTVNGGTCQMQSDISIGKFIKSDHNSLQTTFRSPTSRINCMDKDFCRKEKSLMAPKRNAKNITRMVRIMVQSKNVQRFIKENILRSKKALSNSNLLFIWFRRLKMMPYTYMW